MSIDRTNYNALVDDDGSNTVGSIWNKQAIKNVLLDPIDAAIASAVLPLSGQWVDVPFNAANFSAGSPLTWTVGPAAHVRNRYALVGKVMFWSIYISWFSGDNLIGGSPGPELLITLPGGKTAQQQACPVTYQQNVPGVPILSGVYGLANGSVISIRKGDASNFAVGIAPGLITTFVLETS
jgi:hypothetical protein